jgi:hypothetical protein
MCVMLNRLSHYVCWAVFCAVLFGAQVGLAQDSSDWQDVVVRVESDAPEESPTPPEEPVESSEPTEADVVEEPVTEDTPASIELVPVEDAQPDLDTSPPADLPDWARVEPNEPRLVTPTEDDSESEVGQVPPSESLDDEELGRTERTESARLLREQGDHDVPVTGEDPTEGQAPPLARDGSFIQNRKCRLYRHPDTNWLLLRFLPDDAGRAPSDCWVLPGSLLEEMEKTASVQPDAIFRVSGESKTYQRRAFIYLGKVGVESEFDPLEGTTREDTAGDVEVEVEPDPEDVRTVEEGSSDAVMAELLDDRPSIPVVQPHPSAPGDRDQEEGVAPEIEEQDVAHPGRGQSVVDRTVILLPTAEGKWTEVVFESDNHGQEPPLRALPCGELAKAERINSDRPHESVRFKVSGVITEYKGKRYLLIRKALERRDMDEF